MPGNQDPLLYAEYTTRMKTEKETLETALEAISKSHKIWLWCIFIVTASPGILNAMHITSYVFLTGDDNHYCYIAELENASTNWTKEQIRNISSPVSDMNNTRIDGCERLNWNYSELALLNFQEALSYIKSSNDTPAVVPCTEYVFEESNTVISEWNLVCDRFNLRSHIQSVFGFGKFCGAFIFGVTADKIGRKYSFNLAALCYMISAPLAAFISSFYVFLIVRFIIGLAGAGCYGTAYTLLSEIIMGGARTWVCSLYNISYPIGMLLLAILAYNTHSWRILQIIMSIPTLFLVLNCCPVCVKFCTNFSHYYPNLRYVLNFKSLAHWKVNLKSVTEIYPNRQVPKWYTLSQRFLPESPQWLLSQNRKTEAWNVIKNIDPSSVVPPDNFVQYDKVENRKPWHAKLKDFFKKLLSMFSTAELTRRSLICYFIWCVSSMTYYGLALNGENFNVNRYMYISLNGALEMLSYAIPIPMLAVIGRKSSTVCLLAITGICLLSILVIPKSSKNIILIVALIGRFCSSASFVIFVLLTAELFPTSIRNTAIGTSLTMSHIGTMVAPYIVDLLGYYGWYIPSTIFGIFALLGTLVIIPLPETKNKPLFNSVEEMTIALKTLPPST